MKTTVPVRQMQGFPWSMASVSALGEIVHEVPQVLNILVDVAARHRLSDVAEQSADARGR